MCLDALNKLLAMFKITETGEKVLISGEEVVQTLNGLKVGFTEGLKITQISEKGFSFAKVGMYAKKYPGAAVLVLIVSHGIIKAAKGIYDHDGNKIAEAVLETACLVGSLIGAEIGTMILPGVGLLIGGLIGHMASSMMV